MKCPILRVFLVYLFLLIAQYGVSQDIDHWLTFYEQSDYKETPRYQETIAFAQKLAANSNYLSYQSFGRSPEGRDLPLLIFDKSGATSIEEINNNGKAIILIQACIHAGESDGKDAGLMLLRDMAIQGKYLDLLENITVLFVPIFNVDGHERFGPYNRINQNGPEEMGWRATAQRLNLNRDYLKADSPEMRAMVRLYQQYLPDFYIDCHVTDGADYIYPLTYGLQMHGNLTFDQSNWLKDDYLNYVEKSMKASNNPIAPYMDFVQWHNPMKGIRKYMEIPRYSGGYAAINNRPALLIEAHMLKDYKTRVIATYEMLLNSMKLIASQSEKLQKINLDADNQAKNLSIKSSEYPLTYSAKNSEEKFYYEGFDYTMVESDISGGNWNKYSDTPKSFEIDYYNWEAEITIKLPQAYLVPAALSQLIEKLELHNVQMENLKEDTILNIETYEFHDVSWRNKPFEGRVMLDYKVKPIMRKMHFSAGSKLVRLNQRAAQLAIHMLEPQAPDALVRWGFINTIFEQKEYAESYVIEKMARKMLAENPELKDEFEVWKKSNEQSASNPYAVWTWFYKRTPYWDENIAVYPIGRIMNK